MEFKVVKHSKNCYEIHPSDYQTKNVVHVDRCFFSRPLFVYVECGDVTEAISKAEELFKDFEERHNNPE